MKPLEENLVTKNLINYEGKNLNPGKKFEYDIFNRIIEKTLCLKENIKSIYLGGISNEFKEKTLYQFNEKYAKDISRNKNGRDMGTDIYAFTYDKKLLMIQCKDCKQMRDPEKWSHVIKDSEYFNNLIKKNDINNEYAIESKPIIVTKFNYTPRIEKYKKLFSGVKWININEYKSNAENTEISYQFNLYNSYQICDNIKVPEGKNVIIIKTSDKLNHDIYDTLESIEMDVKNGWRAIIFKKSRCDYLRQYNKKITQYCEKKYNDIIIIPFLLKKIETIKIYPKKEYKENKYHLSFDCIKHYDFIEGSLNGFNTWEQYLCKNNTVLLYNNEKNNVIYVEIPKTQEGYNINDNLKEYITINSYDVNNINHPKITDDDNNYYLYSNFCYYITALKENIKIYRNLNINYINKDTFKMYYANIQNNSINLEQSIIKNYEYVKINLAHQSYSYIMYNHKKLSLNKIYKLCEYYNEKYKTSLFCDKKLHTYFIIPVDKSKEMHISFLRKTQESQSYCNIEFLKTFDLPGSYEDMLNIYEKKWMNEIYEEYKAGYIIKINQYIKKIYLNRCIKNIVKKMIFYKNGEKSNKNEIYNFSKNPILKELDMTVIKFNRDRNYELELKLDIKNIDNLKYELFE
ncbi:MAG: hypothetical protein ACOCP8_02325 [archaeon]